MFIHERVGKFFTATHRGLNTWGEPSFGNFTTPPRPYGNVGGGGGGQVGGSENAPEWDIGNNNSDVFEELSGSFVITFNLIKSDIHFVRKLQSDAVAGVVAGVAVLNRDGEQQFTYSRVSSRNILRYLAGNTWDRSDNNRS